MPVITKILTNTHGARPVSVDFQNGKIQPGEESNLKSKLYQNVDGNAIVGITTNKMLYTGVLDKDELYNNFLLVHNRENDEVQLIQIDHCSVFPRINKQKTSQHFETGISDNSVSELNKQFGSKKTKRLTEQRERLTMNIDAVKEQLEKSVTNMKMDVDGSTEVQPTANDSLYRPKINRDASTRDGVYNLEDVVPSHVLDTLLEEARDIISVGSVENYGLSPFTTACISKILNAEDAKLRNITIFLYIHYLMKFMNTPMKSVTKKFVVCNKSTEVNNHILDNFSVQSQNGRTRPLHMKDKCLCYIIVLTAIANEYEVNVELLAKDLKIGMKKAIEISRILAFNASTKNKSVVTLNLPLPAPVTFNPKRKKR